MSEDFARTTEFCHFEAYKSCQKMMKARGKCLTTDFFIPQPQSPSDDIDLNIDRSSESLEVQVSIRDISQVTVTTFININL